MPHAANEQMSEAYYAAQRAGRSTSGYSFYAAVFYIVSPVLALIDVVLAWLCWLRIERGLGP